MMPIYKIRKIGVRNDANARDFQQKAALAQVGHAHEKNLLLHFEKRPHAGYAGSRAAV